MDDAVFNERFWFLDDDQRAVLKSIWLTRDTHKADMMVDIIRELADHIDSEAEWQRINRLTPAELDEELRASGVDPEEVRRHAADIRTKVERLMTEKQEAADKARLDSESPNS